MINNKSKYLAMKLKYINAKNKLKGGVNTSRPPTTNSVAVNSQGAPRRVVDGNIQYNSLWDFAMNYGQDHAGNTTQIHGNRGKGKGSRGNTSRGKGRGKGSRGNTSRGKGRGNTSRGNTSRGNTSKGNTSKSNTSKSNTSRGNTSRGKGNRGKGNKGRTVWVPYPEWKKFFDGQDYI